ncbi:hypothetical protein [Coxiella-like endosymbiont of Rhipicephalus sanguineus]|uniref:hypothetical protein n=1 Tax=Coxiella-like endosymbiont of Rhipicephalus sanguineus TaxID=1955402 RepID=UPI0020415895|nr:hypothetical protein [Coxiella-like endosymbiont of Rhipicephalus sanguineus]
MTPISILLLLYFLFCMPVLLRVPDYPPNQIPGCIDVSVPHLQSIIKNVSPSIVLTIEKYYSFF